MSIEQSNVPKYIVMQRYSSPTAKHTLYKAITKPVTDLESARCYAELEREENPKKRVIIVQVIEEGIGQ